MILAIQMNAKTMNYYYYYIFYIIINFFSDLNLRDFEFFLAFFKFYNPREYFSCKFVSFFSCKLNI